MRKRPALPAPNTVRSGRLTTEIVLKTAERLGDRLGLDHVTLLLLARELGIRSPSLYNHVEGIKGLHRLLALRGLRELNHVLLQNVAGKSGKEALCALCYTLRTFAHANPCLYEAIQNRAIKSDPALKAHTEELMKTALAGLSGFKLEKNAALHALRVLRSATHGFIMLEKSEGFGLDLDPEESFRLMVACLVAGLASNSRART